MRIAFIDLGPLDYDAETPLRQPLGGTESALCYLATELAGSGHRVSVYNKTSTPGETRGVVFRNRQDAGALHGVEDNDVAIVIGSADALALRRAGISIPLVMWTGHVCEFGTVQQLSRPDEIAEWNAFVFVSEWQREGYLRRFAIDPARTAVLRNAIAPSFEAIEPCLPWFETGDSPVLVYTSTPFRGLAVLLHAFARIRAAIPEARLRLFSGMATYQAAEQDAAFAGIYRHANAMAGVECVGPVGQSRLAGEIRTAAALAYPSIYPETSCISVLEAMRCGCAILTTRLGALPETAGSFGRYVEMPAHARDLVERYAAMVIDALNAMRADPASSAGQRAAQIRHVREHYTWSIRAAEWTAWLEQLLGNTIGSRSDAAAPSLIA